MLTATITVRRLTATIARSALKLTGARAVLAGVGSVVAAVKLLFKIKAAPLAMTGSVSAQVSTVTKTTIPLALSGSVSAQIAKNTQVVSDDHAASGAVTVALAKQIKATSSQAMTGAVASRVQLTGSTLLLIDSDANTLADSDGNDLGWTFKSF